MLSMPSLLLPMLTCYFEGCPQEGNCVLGLWSNAAAVRIRCLRSQLAMTTQGENIESSVYFLIATENFTICLSFTYLYNFLELLFAIGYWYTLIITFDFHWK